MICGIYKYVWHDEIVYIGKADKDIMSRIVAHKAESKFQPYLKDCVIWYTECVNPAHTTILETYLINKYKPKLNVSMKYACDLPINIVEPEWKPISELPCEKCTSGKKKRVLKIKGDIWLKNRHNDINVLKRKITSLKWMRDVLGVHHGEYGFEFSIPEWIWDSAAFPSIDTSLNWRDDGIYIALITRAHGDKEKNEYSAHFADLEYIKRRTEDVEDFDFWRDYQSLILKTIAKYKGQIKEIEEQIRINEELKHELERKRVVV